jgi:hypothetical protein
MAVVHTVSASIFGRDAVAFDEHAIKRMKERSITEAQVLATLQKPDITGLRADPGRKRLRRHYGLHHSVDVVYEEEASRIVVISAIRVVRKQGRKK